MNTPTIDKKSYETPKLTVVTFKYERGYGDSFKLGLTSGRGRKTIEDRQDGGNWGGNDGWF